MRRTSAMMAMRMTVFDPDPAYVVVMRRLRRAGIALVADDLGTVFEELAIHSRLRFADLVDAIGERADHLGMVTQIERLDKFDFRKETGDGLGLLVDPFDQDTSKQEIRKHDDAAEAEPRGAGQGRVDARIGDTAKRNLG